ncbi:hypothetical protein ONZ45_g5812 [Pleurotus djamor]|nr:hypothetical protein ONZ45_g5812 [Pleurotus djamor]
MPSPTDSPRAEPAVNDNDSTPPTPGRPGTKTPRKVQWMDERGTHSLDEEGLNPMAFRNLATALEHHRSSSQLGQVDLHTPSSSLKLDITCPPEPPHIQIDREDNTTSDLSDTDPSVPPTPAPPQHSVPDNYIEPTENAGLPGRENCEAFAEHQAAQVVRAHTRKGFLGLRRRKREPAVVNSAQAHTRDDRIKSKDFAGSVNLNDPNEKDVEQIGHAESPRPLGVGGGVLSTLLTLYDSRNFASESSTPRTSFSEGDYYDERVRDERKRPAQARRMTRESVIGPPSPLAHEVEAEDRPGEFPKRPKYHLPRYSLDSHLFRRGVPVASDSAHSPGFQSTDRTHNQSASSTDSGTPEKEKERRSHKLRDLPFAHSVLSLGHGGWSGRSTPTHTDDEDWKENERRKDREKRRKKKKEHYITRHVAEIIKRQEFILKLARAMMMFGGPSHRLQAQLQATARVLDIPLSCMYLPDVILISFDDSVTATSNVRLIRQSSALDLGKLQAAYRLYWKVIHDKVSVAEASPLLDELMLKPPTYKYWQTILIGGMCSSAICTVGFNGSFIDALVVYPLGALLVSIQMLSVRNELYSNIFEITIATLLSFLAAALAETHRFCYSAVASASVVLILPGFIVLSGALELMSRNMVAGAVRLCYAVMYALFLGFGLAIGAEAYQTIRERTIVGAEDYACTQSHDPLGMWYQRTPSKFWAFLTVPLYSFSLSLRNQMPWRCKEMVLLVAIACVGWVVNYFTAQRFRNQNDISAAFGAFTVGVISNLYGRFFSGNAFIVMITGILFQLPSGLGYGGLLTFASQQSSGFSSSYVSGFQTALQLISVGIGLSVGLGISLVVVHPIQSRRRAGGVFSL